MNMNSVSKIKERRYRDNLANSGGGYILFGFWGIIRVIMELTMRGGALQEIIKEVDIEQYSIGVVYLVTFIMFAIAFLIILFVHLTIGISAIRFSEGKKKRKGFLALAAIVMLVIICCVPFDFYSTEAEKYVVTDRTIISAVVDLTMFFMLFDIFRSTVAISRLTRTKNEKGEAGNAG